MISEKEYQKEYHLKYQKEHNKKRMERYYKKHEESKLKQREYDKKRIKERKIYKHNWWIKNRDRFLNKYYMYRKNRYKTNINYRITDNLRSRLHIALKGLKKSAPTLKLLGCTIDELKLHLQQTAINNGYASFNINNYSGQEYHIDHLRPCSSFNLTNEIEQKECFNWSNLQILSKSENLEKLNKFI